MEPKDVIAKIAGVATVVGWRAGVGSMETAGQIVSFLAAHPEHVDAFVADELDVIECGLLRQENGCLSWHGMDGKIHTPAELRAITRNPDA